MDQTCTKAFGDICSILGDIFPIQSFIHFLEQLYGKPILIEDKVMDISISGSVANFEDGYIIIVRQGLDDGRRKLTILHELSHIYFNHVKVSEIKHKSLSDQERADRLSVVSCYDPPLEKNAELLATYLYTCVRRYEDLGGDGLPRIAYRRLLGR